MSFIGTTTEWNQFSQDATDSYNETISDKIETVEGYCCDCDKETEGWESTWYCPIDGPQWDFNCNECCPDLPDPLNDGGA